MSKPQETYTFSRALHMMRYGGKKMRCLEWNGWDNMDDGYISVSDDDLVIQWGNRDKITSYCFSSNEIMGEWLEVK